MFKKLTETYSVIGRQLEVSDIPEIARSGYKTIICNRPDGEEEDQTQFQSIEQEASKYGIASLFLPVSSGDFSTGIVEEFSQALAQLPTPVLGYCRTGTRATILWALSEKSSGTAVESIMQASNAAGYDVARFV